MYESAAVRWTAGPSWLWFIVVVVTGLAVSALLVLDLPTIYLVAIPGAAVGLAILRKPLLGLYLIALALPIDVAGNLIAITGTFNISIAWIFTLLTLGAWLVDMLQTRRGPVFPAEAWVLVCYLIVGIMSLATAQEFDRGVEEVVRILQTILFFLLVINLIQTSKQLNTVIAILVTATVLTFAYALAQKFIIPANIIQERGLDLLRPGAVTYGVEMGKVDTNGLDTVERVTGTTIHAGVLALNCAYMLPFILLYQRLNSTSFWAQIATWGAVLLSFGAFATTLSRSGFLTLGFTVVMLVWVGILRISGVQLIAIAIIGLLGLPFLPPGYIDRVLSVDSYTTANSASLNGRMELWGASLQAILDHPVTGFGIGNEHGIFDYWMPDLRDQLGTVLNTWLQIAMEVGIQGLVVFIWFIWLLFYRLLDGRARFRASGNRQMLLLGDGLFVLLTALVISWMSVEFLRGGFKNVWLLLACMVAYHRMALIEKPELDRKRYGLTALTEPAAPSTQLRISIDSC